MELFLAGTKHDSPPTPCSTRPLLKCNTWCRSQNLFFTLTWTCLSAPWLRFNVEMWELGAQQESGWQSRICRYQPQTVRKHNEGAGCSRQKTRTKEENRQTRYKSDNVAFLLPTTWWLAEFHRMRSKFFYWHPRLPWSGSGLPTHPFTFSSHQHAFSLTCNLPFSSLDYWLFHNILCMLMSLRVNSASLYKESWLGILLLLCPCPTPTHYNLCPHRSISLRLSLDINPQETLTTSVPSDYSQHFVIPLLWQLWWYVVVIHICWFLVQGTQPALKLWNLALLIALNMFWINNHHSFFQRRPYFNSIKCFINDKKIFQFLVL